MDEQDKEKQEILQEEDVFRLLDSDLYLWERYSKGSPSNSILLTDFPEGCMARWSNGFNIASISTKRELLSISRALCFLKSEGAKAHHKSVPKYFYDASKQKLLARGEMLSRVAYQHSHQADLSPIVEPVAKVQ